MCDQHRAPCPFSLITLSWRREVLCWGDQRVAGCGPGLKVTAVSQLPFSRLPAARVRHLDPAPVLGCVLRPQVWAAPLAGNTHTHTHTHTVNSNILTHKEPHSASWKRPGQGCSQPQDCSESPLPAPGLPPPAGPGCHLPLAHLTFCQGALGVALPSLWHLVLTPDRRPHSTTPTASSWGVIHNP